MSNENSQTTTTEVGFGLDWNNIDSWDYLDILEPLHINLTHNQKVEETTTPDERLGLYPKIVKLYAYFKENANVSSYDSEEYALPFAETDLDNIAFTLSYGKVEVDGKELWHSGIDLSSVDKTEGIPVRAVAAGSIFSSCFSEETGNTIVIKHNTDTNYSIYCHLKESLKKDGEAVTKGEIIGYMGKTGETDRPQLHLQINSFINGAYKNGTENPLKFFTKLADKLGKSNLA